MTIPDVDTIFTWRGRTVRDPSGDKVGRLGDVYLDEATDEPAYAGVHTGMFGLKESVVPLDALREDGEDLVVAYDAELVRDAPRIDPDDALAPEEEERLARHYASVPGGRGDQDAGEREDAGSGDAMTRSEEEVVTSRGEMQPAERVRIRKVLVTDHVTKTVPVQREEVRLETEPPPEGARVERVDQG